MNILASLAPISTFAEPSTIATFCVGVAIYAAIDVIVFFSFRRWVARVSLLSIEILSVIAWLFGLDLVFGISLALFATTFLFGLFTNLSETRALFANNMTLKNLKIFNRKSVKKGEVLFDREEAYGKVRDAVLYMSKVKMGAIITFEREDTLDGNMGKDAVKINAPISTELIETIFYEGSRLHDGALIIRDDKIYVASAYYTPTTRPLTGKYGSRHRAAIGISEVCDAVTIVVSEETGRISIAFEGELTPCTPDNFYENFLSFMNSKD